MCTVAVDEDSSCPGKSGCTRLLRVVDHGGSFNRQPPKLRSQSIGSRGIVPCSQQFIQLKIKQRSIVTSEEEAFLSPSDCIRHAAFLGMHGRTMRASRKMGHCILWRQQCYVFPCAHVIIRNLFHRAKRKDACVHQEKSCGFYQERQSPRRIVCDNQAKLTQNCTYLRITEKYLSPLLDW